MINILVQDQKVKLFWSNRIKNHFINKGYNCTGRNDPFYVDAKDLIPGSDIHVKVLCDKCWAEFTTPYNAHIKRLEKHLPDLCKPCAAEYGHSKLKFDRAKTLFDKVKVVCAENNYHLITKESEYISAQMSVDFECEKHGVQTMLIHNLVKGCKCIKCSYEERGEQCRNDIDYIENTINSFNGNILLNKQDYRGSNVRNLIVKCGKCGKRDFVVSFSGYCNNEIRQCRSCSSAESKGEKVVANYLEANGITFEREKKFADCKDKRPLPFDFYLPNYNLIIEFDGKHHFEDVYGDGHLDIVKKHDCIKNDFCKERGIHLLRIPYWDGKKVSKIIDEKIKSIIV